jgi:hypothetical protein
MLQIASAMAFEDVLKDVFAKDVKLEWVVVTVSFYTPNKKPDRNVFKLEESESNYMNIAQCEITHKVQPPITITRASLGLFTEILKTRQAVCSQNYKDHEMALGVTWLGGKKNTSFNYINTVIFDGAPDLDLEDLPKAVKKHLDKFTILNTGNSYHFYKKSDAAEPPNYTLQQVINKLQDDNWRSVQEQNGGYIRVTANVKGGITAL